MRMSDNCSDIAGVLKWYTFHSQIYFTTILEFVTASDVRRNRGVKSNYDKVSFKEGMLKSTNSMVCRAH